MWGGGSNSQFDNNPVDFKFKSSLVGEGGSEINIDLVNYGPKIYLHMNKRTTNKYFKISFQASEFYDIVEFLQSRMMQEMKKMEKQVTEKYGLVGKDDLFDTDSTNGRASNTYVIEKSKQTMKREKKRKRAIMRQRAELMKKQAKFDEEILSSDDSAESTSGEEEEGGEEEDQVKIVEKKTQPKPCISRSKAQ